MPAIDLQRLRTQIGLLKQVYQEPARFTEDLREVYISYSDRTFPVKNNPALNQAHPLYGVPPLLNRELELAFSDHCVSEPEATLAIIDQLWQEEKLEPRQFAVLLLNRLPVEYSERVVDRIQQWSSEHEDSTLIRYLHDQGTRSLRARQPQLWLKILTEWKTANNVQLNKLSVTGILPLIEDPDYQNLPAIFTYLTPLLEKPDARLLFNLQSIVENLAKRSEPETVYFLKEIISRSKDPGLPRLIRRCLEYFSTPVQNSLRTYLKDHEKTS